MMGDRLLSPMGGDSLLDAQRRLRVGGRIRSGWSEPYTTADGKERRRPVRSETLVLTSAQRAYLDAAAEQWGGQVERWQPQGSGPELWRLVTEQESIDAILPPGDPLNQALEMWSGGGCVRRCNGQVEKLSGKPCICYAQFGETFYERKPTEVCRPTSRLSVFLDLPDFVLWTLETHSHYAALEMAATVDLIKGRVGTEDPIPVALRIDQRSRVAAGKTKHFPVVVIELRGTTTREILMGRAPALELDAGPARAALPAGPSGRQGGWEAEVDASAAAQGWVPPTTYRGWVREIEAASSVPDLRAVYKQVQGLGEADLARLMKVFWARHAALSPGSAATADKEPTPGEPVDDHEQEPPHGAPVEQEPNRGALWMEAVNLGGQLGYSGPQLEALMVEKVGYTPADADGWAMEQFVTVLKGIKP